jgi:hypothetical protein
MRAICKFSTSNGRWFTVVVPNDVRDHIVKSTNAERFWVQAEFMNSSIVVVHESVYLLLQLAYSINETELNAYIQASDFAILPVDSD